MTTASSGTLYFERTPGGQLLSVQSGTGGSVANYDYVPDGLGSIVAMVPANTTSSTTAGGTAVAAYSYTPYGAVATITDPAGGDLTVANANPFRFTGAYQDLNTKLIHLGARWYDPNTGRFTQQDGITHLTDLTQGNRYAYAGDNPANNLDPSGAGIWGDFLDSAETLLSAKSFSEAVNDLGSTDDLEADLGGAAAGLVTDVACNFVLGAADVPMAGLASVAGEAACTAGSEIVGTYVTDQLKG